MRSLLEFFTLTYLVSWAAWIGGAAIVRNATPAPVGFVALNGLLYLLGVFAPALVALALTARAEGRAGVLALLGRTLHGSVRVRWYAFALGYMAAIKLAAAHCVPARTGG